jgi:non-specific serine/threonine protein kinase/serine/threonine-protein kinase
VSEEGFDWGDAKRIFSEALEQSPENRSAYLSRACGTNSALHREVVSLLENHDRAGSFFDQPLAAAIAPPADPMIGKRVGLYKVLRQIGLGGMGTVYLAERADDQFRKRVALKAVRPELLNEHALRRFQNERQTLAVLDHPNIIQLLDGGTTDEGVPYLVTEYVEGQPIDRYASSAGLSVRQKLDLFFTLLGAVHYAHQHLVVHRDLKPGNILVTPAGVPKLLDFGIAKLLQPEYSPHAMGLTQSNMQPMTPNFASPEQIAGQPVTTASDIYSLGVILYQLLTGHHPYERQMHNAFELSHAICETEPEKPSKLVATAEPLARVRANALRGDLDTIVLKAMRKEPRRRYASVEHFSEDIRRYLEGFPVLARKSSVWYRATKFIGRHKASSAGLALLTAGLAVTSVVALDQKRAAERRFADLREFANFVLTGLDRELLRGTTPARALLAEKGVKYLDKLAAEKGLTPSIKRDLVNGYLKNGEVKGNLYGASLGETAGAEDSYRKALRYAGELVRADPSNLEDRGNLVHAHRGLAEVLSTSGNRAEAIRHYEEAIRIQEATLATAAPDENTLREAANLWDSMGSLRLLSSDPASALDCYRHALPILERLPATYANKVNLLAYMRENIANAMVLAGGDASGAEQIVLQSIATYQHRVDVNPIPRARRLLAQAYQVLADVQRHNGNNAEALQSMRRSLQMTETLLAEDPKDEQARLDRQQGLMQEIELLIANGQTAEARAETKRALGIMKPLAAESTQFQHAQDYAQLLATTPFDELRDDAAALSFARKAVQMTHESDPDVLHTLALAYQRNGNLAGALETGKKALALLPAGAPSLFRTKLDEEIRRWQK